MVQSLRSLLEEGSLEEAKAKLKELEEKIAGT